MAKKTCPGGGGRGKTGKGGGGLKTGLIDVDGHNGLEETMDRFTVKARSNCGFVWALRTPGCTVQEAIDRLAAYENTGLEPEEITAEQGFGKRRDAVRAR